MEKLKLSLSKQHNKVLNIKSEMLKIKKMSKILSAKIFGNFLNPSDPKDYLDSGNLMEFPRNFLKLSCFPGS